MHINDIWSKASRPAQLLTMLVTTALVILGVTSLPTYAAAPTLKLAINADEDSYLSGVEQRYVVEFSCASTTEDCLNSVVTITLPHTITPSGSSNPDSAPDGVNATATVGNKVVTPEIKCPTATTDGLVTYNLGTVAAGTSFQTVLTFTAPRGVTPGSSTVTPVATFSSGDTTVTAQDTVTIYSEPTPLLSKTGPVATPKNVDVTYQITPKYDTTIDGLNGKTNMTNVVVTDPLPQCATYVSSTASGNTITNTAATVPSSYDAATHTVTWNIGDVNPAFMNVVLSVTVHYDDTCTDDTVTNTAKLTGNEMHNETKTLTANASFTHHFDNEVRYGGGFNKRAMSQFERGKQGNWLYSYDNKSNVPVVMEYTDYMTCGLVSPTDGSKDCDKPLMRVKTIDTQTTTPIEITYWTNKGNTGTQTVSRGKAFDFSSFAADEYLTVFHYKQTIPAGESSILNVAGPIGAGTPTTEDGVTYVDVDKNAAAWKAGKSDQWVRVQNCVTDFSMKSLDGTHDIAIPADDFCDVLTLGTALPKYYNAKSTIKGSLASPGSEVTFSVTANNTSTVVDSQPVISDLLPCGMTFVEGSVTGGPAGKEKTVTVRDVTDATGCTRQLVQVTWPGYQTKGGTTIQLRGKVGPSMSAGTHKNEAYISAAEPEYALTSKKATICFYGSTDDTYDVNGDGNTADQVCPVSSTFTVSEQAGADVVLESLGSVPGSVYKKYTDGPSVMRQGEDGQFRITPTNSGNADLSDMTLYGILPYVGDTSVQGGASRDSEWEPIMTGPIQIGTGSGIDTSQVTIEYSTSTNPCRGEVINQGDAMTASPAGCDNNWTATPASWSDVKSYRVYINGQATPIKAGASIPLIVPIKAPDNASGIAYESVAIAATQASNNRAILPTEPIKVALVVALDVALNKTVVSDVDNLAPGDSVTFRIDAGNSGQGKAPDVKVAEAFPAGTTFVSAESHLCTSGYTSGYTSGVPGECNTGGTAGTFDGTTWKLSDMLAGQYASLYVTVTLDEGTDGKTLENTASFVNPPEYDQNPDNNIAKASISVKHRLSGKVYYDANDSSSYTNGEEGFKDITVELLGPDGAVIATTTTDTDGNYSFTRLPAGKYTVKVEPSDLLKKLEQTEDPDGTKDHTSGVVQVNHDSPSVQNVNFGYATNYTIKGTIYRDADRSESLEDGEKLYQGVTVDLLDNAGNVVATTTTDAHGAYAFTNLEEGTYKVRVRKEGPIVDLDQTEDPDATKDNTSGDITLELNDPIKENVNFGYISDNSISGTVYRDDNRSGALNSGESGYPEQTVQLLDKDGTVIATTKTDANGMYSFDKLPDGTYSVKVVKDGALADNEQTGDPDSTLDNASEPITLNEANPTKKNVDFGYVPDYFIKGTIYRDGNRSGALDTDEKLYEGVTVQLRDADGTVVATTTTDADGAYSFDKLPAGTYTVTVVQDGPIAGLEQTGDPDATKDNASESITLNNDNPSTTDVNFGYVNNNSLSGTVYRDDSRNGDQDGTEPGYSGVIVQLLDKDGQVITTTTTDANGRYSFDKLPDGTYSVTVVKDGELADTEQTEDPDATKDNSSEPVTLGEDNPFKDHIDFGYVPDYSIHGLVYRDGDRSESHGTDEKGYANQTVELRDKDGKVVATTTTDADGAYSFEKLPAGDYTVTVVKDGALTDLDQTEDPDSTKDSASGVISLSNDHRTRTDVNFGYIANNSINGSIYRDGDRDGRKGDTEGRYSGVTVQLLDENGTVIATTTTDKDGTYSFEHLSDGTYSIKVVKDGVLADADQTGDPDTTLDNASKPITLDENSPTKSDVDFGYVPNNTITGTVYRDDNRDKMIDGDEPGLERVSVQLLDEDGNVVQTLDTAADGTYAFQHLKDGKYTVKVVRSSAIKDYDQTEDPDATIDDTSAVYTMGPENSLQENVNFGYVPDYSIAGRVYRDADKSGSYTDGEETFEGVTVDLIDASGTVVATATTTADGTYSFEKLPAGTYRVKVHADGALADLDQTEDPDGIADSMSGEITIGFDNQTVTGVNFGYVAPDAPATKPSTSLAQRLARTGFDGLVGTAGLGSAAAGGLLLWMRRRRQG